MSEFEKGEINELYTEIPSRSKIALDTFREHSYCAFSNPNAAKRMKLVNKSGTDKCKLQIKNKKVSTISKTINSPPKEQIEENPVRPEVQQTLERASTPRVYVPKKNALGNKSGAIFVDVSADVKIEEDSIIWASDDEDTAGEPQTMTDENLLHGIDISEICLTDILEQQKLSSLEPKKMNCFKTLFALRKDGQKHFVNEATGISLDDYKAIGEPIVLKTFNNSCEITVHKLHESRFLVMFSEETYKEEVDKKVYIDFINKICQYKITNTDIKIYYLLDEDDLEEIHTTKAFEILTSNNYPKPTEHKYKKFNVFVHPIAYPKNILNRSKHFREKRTYIFQFTYPTHQNVLMQNLKDFHKIIVNHILGKTQFIKTYYRINCKPINSNFHEYSLVSHSTKDIRTNNILKSKPLIEQYHIGGVLKLSVFTIGCEYLIECVSITIQNRLTHVKALRKVFAMMEKQEMECTTRRIMRDCVMVPGICIACQYKYETQAQYFRHKDETGHSQQMRMCSLCKEIVSNEKILSSHLIDTHLQKDFKCNLCKKFKNCRILCDGHRKEYIIGEQLEKKVEYEKLEEGESMAVEFVEVL